MSHLFTVGRLTLCPLVSSIRTPLFFIVCAWLLLSSSLHPLMANGYIQHSRYLGGSASEQDIVLAHEGPYIYIAGVTNSANYPTTMGGGLQAASDVVITKKDTTGNIVYSRYIGSKGISLGQPRPALAVENGSAYLCFLTAAAGFPTTNGTDLSGQDDYLVVKLDPSGNIVFSTYWGGTRREAEPGIAVWNEHIYIGGVSYSNDYPLSGSSMGALVDGGSFVVTCFHPSGNMLYSIYWGGTTGVQNQSVLRVEDGFAYMAGVSTSTDYPATVGTAPNQQGSFIVARIAPNGALVYNRLMSGSNSLHTMPRLEVHNGFAYLAGFSSATNYPVLNGFSYPGGGGNYVLSKIEPNGNLAYSTYVGGSDTEDAKFLAFALEHGTAYLMGGTRSVDFPVTNGSVYPGATSFILAKFSISGSLLLATYLGGSGNESSPAIAVRNGYVLAGGTSSSANYPVTNGTLLYDNDFAVTLFDPSGNLVYSTLLGGHGAEWLPRFILRDDYAIVGGYSGSGTYPVTTSGLKSGPTDFVWTMIRFCPPYNDENTIAPIDQLVCENGKPELLTGNAIMANAAELPLIYRAASATPQGNLAARYQWQEASDPSGPWADISWGILKDFQPPAAVSDKFYRRVALETAICGADTISISEIAAVKLNGYISPVADAGNIINTCPGVAVQLGAAPVADGGSAPYTYLWDFPDFLSDPHAPNPEATVFETSIFTVLVTDQNGCADIDQVVVRVIQANAGPDKLSCGGAEVQIGTPAIAGIPDLIYKWTPDTDISQSTIAQPMVAPSMDTYYWLTITVPLQDGATCQVSDGVQVEVIKAPSDPNFAGKDIVICADKGAVSLGGPGEFGFTYTWSPGNYLNAVNAPSVIFNANNDLPNPDPFIYYLTASRKGCSFMDDIKVTVIEAKAGRDGCGPRIIGNGDRTPLINETYEWKLISGPGAITGPVNTPTTTVSASVGGASTYLLTVCLGETCCSDEVVVPDCGCDIVVSVGAASGCPQFDYGPVTLTATAGSVYVADPNEFAYSWTPCDGLSACTGRVVQLTDNIPRTYTVTMTSPIDNDFVCSTTVSVNHPSWALPVFSANDAAICRGDSVQIGAAPVAGYTYQWSGPNGFTSVLSNPFVAPLASAEYFVTVTEQISGCSIRDTAYVAVSEVIADAGLDWTVCELAIIELGSQDLSGGNSIYHWSPEIAPWQSSTTHQSPQPIVLVATTLDFYLEVTDPLSGCKGRDTVSVNVTNNPVLPVLEDLSICRGDSVLIGFPASPGVTYSWTPATGLSCASCSQTWAKPTANVSYTLTATYPGNCNATPGTTQQITVNQPAFDLGPDLLFCPSDGDILIGSDAPLGMMSYEWMPDIFISHTDTREVWVSPPYPVQYVLTITDLNGCKASDTLEVIPSSLPPFAGVDATICLGESIQLGDPGITGAATWYGGDGFLSCTNCPNPVFEPDKPGIYNLVLEVDHNGCLTSDEVVIRVEALKLPPMEATTICQQACATIGVTPALGVNYVWSPGTGLINPFAATTEACPALTTTYTLTAVSALSGCTAVQSVTVGVAPLLAPQISMPPLSLCLGEGPGSFSPIITPAPGNYSYTWTPSTGLSSPNQVSPLVYPLSAGTRSYQLSVTDNSTGCSGSAQGQVSTGTCQLMLYGTVFYDVNGLTDLTVNGVGIAFAGTSPLHVLLLDAETNIVLAQSTLGLGGTYQFSVSANKAYRLKLSELPATPGFSSPGHQLPPNWLFMGENVGIGPGSDGLVDGEISVWVGEVNVYHVNFGIADFNLLPIELAYFDVQKLEADKALLEWATASEFNNHFFEVLRSSDDWIWHSLNAIPGAGFSNDLIRYSWIDEKPMHGNNYYRIKQTDDDGSFSFSPIRVLSFDLRKWQPKVFPNPFSTWVQVENLNLQEEGVEAFLYSETGQLLQYFKPLQSQLVTFSDIPAGKYIFLIRQVDTLNQKLFKLVKF